MSSKSAATGFFVPGVHTLPGCLEFITDTQRQQYASLALCAAIKIGLFDYFRRCQLIEAYQLLSDLGILSWPGRQAILPILASQGHIEMQQGLVSLPPSSRNGLLAREGYPDMLGYLGFDTESEAVSTAVENLRVSSPTDARYCLNAAGDSPMNDKKLAYMLTSRLADRAAILAKPLWDRFPGKAEHLVDVGGGSGNYSYGALLRGTVRQVTIVDHPNVIAFAKTRWAELCENIPEAEKLYEQVDFFEGNMFEGLPSGDLVLLSSIIHDWQPAEALKIFHQAAKAVEKGGEVLVHECVLSDLLDGPEHAANYSYQLWEVTQGGCYSEGQLDLLAQNAGLTKFPLSRPTALGYSLFRYANA